MAEARNIIEQIFLPEDQQALGNRLMEDGMRYDVTLCWMNNRLSGSGAAREKDTWYKNYRPKIKARQKRNKSSKTCDGTIQDNVLRKWAQLVIWPAWQRRRADIGDAVVGIARSAADDPLPLMEAAEDLLKQKIAVIALQDTLSDEEVSVVERLMTAINKRDQIRGRREEMELNREKFQFNASEAALEHVAKIKSISADTSLSSRDRVERVREVLFGSEAVEPVKKRKGAKR